MNKIMCGDALAILKTLPSTCVQCAITSPPYYRQRNYNTEEQIGWEKTPEGYIEILVPIFREVRRILKDDGTLWLNLGDTRLEKQLLGIPWRVALALQKDGWYLRSEVVWEKPDALPESMKDRPTDVHEQVFLLSKGKRYYYDADAIREPVTYRDGRGSQRIAYQGKGNPSTRQFSGGATWLGQSDDGMKNRRSVWHINTATYADSHEAVMPHRLVEICTLASSRSGDVVLDPFMGAGTVALTAIQHQRNYVGIELNPDYCKLIEKRIAAVQQTLWIT